MAPIKIGFGTYIPRDLIAGAGLGAPVLFKYTPGDDLSAATFARTGTATYVDVNGILQTAADGVVRDGHYQPDGTRSLRLEGASENLLTESEDFASWTESGTCSVTGSQADPASGTSASLLDASVVGGQRWLAVVLTGDGTKAVSFFLRTGTATQTDMVLRDETAGVNRARVRATWTDGVPALSVAEGSATLYSVVALGSGWYRVMFGADSIIAANSHRCRFYPGSTSSSGSVYVFGAQVEDLTFPTSYIPTAGAAVTRNADSLYFPLSGDPRAMTAYEKAVSRGTAKVQGNHFTVGERTFWVNSPNTSDRVRLALDNGTAIDLTSLGTDLDPGKLIEILASWAANGDAVLAVASDGAAESSNTGNVAMPGSFFEQAIALNGKGIGNTAPGYADFLKFVLVNDVQSMAHMRTL